MFIEEARRSEAAVSTSRAEDSSDERSAYERPVDDAEGDVAAHEAVRNASVDSTPHMTAELPLRIGDATTTLTVSDEAEQINLARWRCESPDEREIRAEPDAAPVDPAIDLERIERRCRLKAESCRVYLERRRCKGDMDCEQECERRIKQMLDQAQSMRGCFLWVFYRERTQPGDEVIQSASRCYTAAAECAALLRQCVDSDFPVSEAMLPQAMEVTAEATSALRVILERTWLERADTDQDELHLWLRQESTARQIYIKRHMKLDDPADPDRADDVVGRARALRRELDEGAERAKRIHQGFRKIEYHVGLLLAKPLDVEYEQEKIAEAIGELCALGVAASDRRFRQSVPAQIATAVRDVTEPNKYVVEVLERVEQWSEEAAGSASIEVDTATALRWSETVLEVRSLLEGRSIVVVGGEPRPDEIERMKDAFALSAVYWVDLTEHGSSQPMQAPIMRPETAVVFVLIRLAGHQHASDANTWAKEAGIPCVRVPAGHNPEQLADAVQQQASEQLRAMVLSD